MAKTKIILGTLILVILTSTFYIYLPGKVRIDFEKSRTVYKVFEDGKFVLAANEYVRLFDGTKKMLAKSRENSYSIYDHDTQVLKEAYMYRDNIKIEQFYSFDNDVESVRNVPVMETVCFYNASGKIFEWLIQDIEYDGETKDIRSGFSFGHNMEVRFEGGYYRAKVYQNKVSPDKIIVRYRINDNFQCFNMRVFDPPGDKIVDSTPNIMRVNTIKNEIQVRVIKLDSDVIVQNITWNNTHKCMDIKIDDKAIQQKYGKNEVYRFIKEKVEYVEVKEIDPKEPDPKEPEAKEPEAKEPVVVGLSTNNILKNFSKAEEIISFDTKYHCSPLKLGVEYYGINTTQVETVNVSAGVFQQTQNNVTGIILLNDTISTYYTYGNHSSEVIALNDTYNRVNVTINASVPSQTSLNVSVSEGNFSNNGYMQSLQLFQGANGTDRLGRTTWVVRNLAQDNLEVGNYFNRDGDTDTNDKILLTDGSSQFASLENTDEVSVCSRFSVKADDGTNYALRADAQGITMEVEAEDIRCVWRGSSTDVAHGSDDSFPYDGTLHTVCCIRNNVTQRFLAYLDGDLKANTSSTGTYGAIQNTWQIFSATDFNGTAEWIVIWNKSLTISEVVKWTNGTYGWNDGTPQVVSDGVSTKTFNITNTSNYVQTFNELGTSNTSKTPVIYTETVTVFTETTTTTTPTTTTTIGGCTAVVPTDGMTINSTENCTFIKNSYDIFASIIPNDDDLVIDCNSSTLTGNETGVMFDLAFGFSNITIKNCIIDNVTGYVDFNRESSTLFNNTFRNSSSTGIVVGASDMSITNNTFITDGTQNVIFSNSVDGLTISGNTLTGATYTAGKYFLSMSTDATDVNLSDNSITTYEGVKVVNGNLTVEGNSFIDGGARQIRSLDCDEAAYNINYTDNTHTDGGWTVDLSNCSNVNLSYNLFNNASATFPATEFVKLRTGSSNSVIYNNSFVLVDRAISTTDGVFNVNITNNYILNMTTGTDGWYAGTTIQGNSSNIRFEGNNITNYGIAGLLIRQSFNVTVNNNIFKRLNWSEYNPLGIPTREPTCGVFVTELYQCYIGDGVEDPSNTIDEVKLYKSVDVIIENNTYNDQCYITIQGAENLQHDITNSWNFSWKDDNLVNKTEYLFNNSIDTIINSISNYPDRPGEVLIEQMFFGYPNCYQDKTKRLNYTISKTEQTFRNTNATNIYNLTRYCPSDSQSYSINPYVTSGETHIANNCTAGCEFLYDNGTFGDTTFCNGTYYIYDGIDSNANSISWNLNGLTMIGDGETNSVGLGIGHDDVRIENGTIKNYYFGMRSSFGKSGGIVRSCTFDNITNTAISSNNANTLLIDSNTFTNLPNNGFDKFITTSKGYNNFTDNTWENVSGNCIIADHNMIIDGDTFFNVSQAVKIDSSDNLTVKNSNFTRCNGFYCIQFDNTSNSKAYDNIANNNTIFVRADDSDNINISWNNASNSTNNYDSWNINILFNYNVTNSYIENNRLLDCGYDCYAVRQSENVTVRDNYLDLATDTEKIALGVDDFYSFGCAGEIPILIKSYVGDGDATNLTKAGANSLRSTNIIVENNTYSSTTKCFLRDEGGINTLTDHDNLTAYNPNIDTYYDIVLYVNLSSFTELTRVYSGVSSNWGFTGQGMTGYAGNSKPELNYSISNNITLFTNLDKTDYPVQGITDYNVTFICDSDSRNYSMIQNDTWYFGNCSSGVNFPVENQTLSTLITGQYPPLLNITRGSTHNYSLASDNLDFIINDTSTVSTNVTLSDDNSYYFRYNGVKRLHVFNNSITSNADITLATQDLNVAFDDTFYLNDDWVFNNIYMLGSSNMALTGSLMAIK